MMTDKQKRIITDMRGRGIPYAAIAHTLGLSPNTVKSFCRRDNIMVHNSDHSRQDRCKNCGAPLKQNPNAKQKIFCCDRCRYAWWNRNRKYAMYQKANHAICMGCGIEFKSHGSKNRKYCGRDCYVHSRYGEGLP